MYRTIFTPTETDNMIPFNIPQEWYGQNVELILFPLGNFPTQVEIIEKREENFKTIPSKYSFSTKNFKFNRDEANDYE